MNAFSEIKENITTKKTDQEFYGFDCTIRFLSFWHIDLMSSTHKLYSEFPHEKCKKNLTKLSLQLNLRSAF